MANEKIEVPYDALLRETMAAMTDAGLLLVTQGKKGGPNAMTIGWGTIGSVWSRPIFAVLVRPSRYTHGLLLENGDFTVNVMPTSMEQAVNHCGAASGRNTDKFRDTGMTPAPALKVKTPIIAESLIAYECRTMMTNEVLPATLDRSIRESAYASGDFHTIFYGEILAARADPGVMAKR